MVVDLKDRVQSLDRALLFLSSFLSFGFSTLLALILKPSISQLALLIPALLMSVILPLYVGYMRGSIEQSDSMMERARGWVYLIFGTSSYALTMIMVPFAFTPNHAPPYIAGILFGAWLILVYFTYRFVKWFYKVTGFTNIPIRDKIGIIATTGASSSAMLGFESIAAVVIGKAIYLNNAPFVYNEFTASIVSVFFAIIPFYLFIVLEINCHHSLGRAQGVFERLTLRSKVRKDPHPNPRAIWFENVANMAISAAYCGLGRPRFIWWPCSAMVLILIGSGFAASNLISGSIIMGIASFILYLSLIPYVRRAYSSTNLTSQHIAIPKEATLLPPKE
ncbi:MAG: hypothetical protein PXY39_12940 [archaeon]|nr:hypothetical protein [archaeon]